MKGDFRNKVSFGKRIEYWIAGEMLKEGLDVYLPTVDDMGIDAVVRRKDGTFIEVQIKACSKDVREGYAADFGVKINEERKNYFFVFYSERMDTKFIMTHEEFTEETGEKVKCLEIHIRMVRNCPRKI